MAATARNPGKSYSDFQQEQDLITLHAEQQVNAFDVYCPQESCRCKLLLASAATLVQREKSKLALPKLPLAGATVSTIGDNNLNSEKSHTTSHDTTESKDAVTATATDANADSEELQSFWRVTDMMAFENIGFSKMLPSGIQFLSCADCDTGPLGYHDSKATQPNKEYLLAINRVRYHDRS
ncbi:hypothetical protein BGZ70_003856 [Mortierella alpina]|uniref:Mss4-like protein n=1 Tax=Mortierella alpina TaxID=64518 RepID=A0A9P6JA98_MORAP|nr:hypothetical protein BGZ70_003856 [Mortierella alpina]